MTFNGLILTMSFNIHERALIFNGQSCLLSSHLAFQELCNKGKVYQESDWSVHV